MHKSLKKEEYETMLCRHNKNQINNFVQAQEIIVENIKKKKKIITKG